MTSIYISSIGVKFLPLTKHTPTNLISFWQPLMNPKDVIALFDSFWFKHGIFKKQSFKSSSEKNPDHQIQEISSEPKISNLPSTLMRSKSDHLSYFSSFSSDMLSPNSVLFNPQLQTIPSGIQEHIEEKLVQKTEKNTGRRRRKKGTFSKSLSDLELEELKGFMDLGFVFSEEDLDSNLVEIIPGLQKLGKKTYWVDQEQVNIVKSSSVPRPYLSEAWEALERKKRVYIPLMNWRIPDPNNEIHMKDKLKWWAQTVASAVR